MTLKSPPPPHAIGVFDSGVGGLTVLQALRRRMPRRDFVYLGDTARVPYGRKPPEMVVEFATEIADFLCGMGVEGLVVACNTASAVALPALMERCAVPAWGVIDPGVEAAARVTRTGSVGVIGTKGPIGSRAYQRRLEARGFQVWAQACPMLVHVVEEGLVDSEEARLLVGQYLSGRPEMDALILGCTHYPLLRGVLQERWARASRWWIARKPSPNVVSKAFEARPHAEAAGPRGPLRHGGSVGLRAHRQGDRRRGGGDCAAAGDGIDGGVKILGGVHADLGYRAVAHALVELVARAGVDCRMLRSTPCSRRASARA